MQVINPFTEKVIKEVREDSPDTIKKKFLRAKKAQKQWAQIPLKERLACIQRFYDLLEKRENTLAKILTSEVGKPITQSHNELKGARNRIRFFLDHSVQWLSEEWMVTDGGLKEKITYEPLGVIANISAWNFPWLVGVNVFVPALIAGNVVLYKPSEHATFTGLEIEKLFHDSGVPKDVFISVVGTGNAGQALLELPLDGYFFTGSYKTGKRIAEKILGKMVPLQLELGGKDPLYVMDDVDNIASVAASAADGAFYNCGQSCCAVERIYVHRKIYDRFVKEFIDEVKRFRVGDPVDKETYIGPLARKEQLTLLESQVKDALKKGANLLTGGQRSQLPGKGWGWAPTVLVNTNHRMGVMKDESFGPIIGIQKVKDDKEALELMQDTEYGLTASVYSKSRERAEKLFEQLDTGSVYWNCCDRVSPFLPWSGRKHSGIGATLSYHGIRAFVRTKGYHLKDTAHTKL